MIRRWSHLDHSSSFPQFGHISAFSNIISFLLHHKWSSQTPLQFSSWRQSLDTHHTFRVWPSFSITIYTMRVLIDMNTCLSHFRVPRLLRNTLPLKKSVSPLKLLRWKTRPSHPPINRSYTGASFESDAWQTFFEKVNYSYKDIFRRCGWIHEGLPV